MSSPTPASSHPRQLSTIECRSVLQHHHEGRLGYVSGRGQRSVVVSFATRDDAIMLAVPDYNEIARYAPGTEVTLEVGDVDHLAPEHVRVTGVAEWVPADTSGDLTAQWPAELAVAVLSVPMARLEGYVEEAA